MLRRLAHCIIYMMSAILATACAMVPSTNVHQPMTATPPVVQQPQANNGAIYQSGYSRLALFEDRRARNVGDTLTILVSEKTNASKKSSSSAERKSDVSASIPTIAGLPFKSFQGAKLGADSDNKFDGKGESAANNLFTGTIAVTVIEVLANGNLVVSGEKQLAINQGTEYVRFSGVVNPTNITAANTVSSPLVADAHIEYKGGGYIDEAQTMGFLARFFLTFLPF